jgi:hypothetical protein
MIERGRGRVRVEASDVRVRANLNNQVVFPSDIPALLRGMPGSER